MYFQQTVVLMISGLTICGVDCLLSAEWKSPNKITARTGQAKGTGDIIVVTRSGGVGSTTVQFRGYNIQIGNVILSLRFNGHFPGEPGLSGVY